MTPRRLTISLLLVTRVILLLTLLFNGIIIVAPTVHLMVHILRLVYGDLALTAGYPVVSLLLSAMLAGLRVLVGLGVGLDELNVSVLIHKN